MDENAARKIAYDLTIEYTKHNTTNVFDSGKYKEGVERFAEIHQKYYDAILANEIMQKLYK